MSTATMPAMSAAYAGGYGPMIECGLDGCEERIHQFADNKRERKYCCKNHGDNASARRVRAADPDPNKKNRLTRQAIRGRRCRWCQRTDGAINAQWSTKNNECDRCNRQRYRYRCGVCDGPYWVTSVGCLTCPVHLAYPVKYEPARKVRHGRFSS